MLHDGKLAKDLHLIHLEHASIDLQKAMPVLSARADKVNCNCLASLEQPALHDPIQDVNYHMYVAGLPCYPDALG